MNHDKYECEFINRMGGIILTPSVGESLQQLSALRGDVNQWLAEGKIRKWHGRASLIQIHRRAIEKLSGSADLALLREHWNELNKLCAKLGMKGVNPTDFVDAAIVYCLNLHDTGETCEAIRVLSDADKRLQRTAHPGVKQWRGEISQCLQRLSSTNDNGHPVA